MVRAKNITEENEHMGVLTTGAFFKSNTWNQPEKEI